MNEYLDLETSSEKQYYFGTLNRRDFIKTVGGGILIFFAVRDVWGQSDREGKRPDFNTFLRIGEDGTVTAFTGKIEMGQGVNTSLAQMLAEELGVPLASIAMVMGDTALCPYDAGTWGSRTTPYFGPIFRAAGAEARGILLELAAEELNVPVEHLSVKDGVIFVKTQKSRQVTYAQLAQGKEIERHLEIEPQLQQPSDFTIIGKPYNRVDAYDKVTGKALYTGDIRVAGMVYASILRPPVHGAIRTKLDTSRAEKMDGVQVIRDIAGDDELVAALHPMPDVAQEACSKIRARWDNPKPLFDDETVYDYFVENAGEGNVDEEQGDLAAGEIAADKIIEERYMDSYTAHAPIEPHTALAQWKGDKLTVWASSQTPFGTRDQLSRAFNMPKESVRVISPYLGGGFGGKIPNDQAIEAARLSRASGKPVMLAWTREEEFFYDRFRPAAAVIVRSGMTDAGEMKSWDYKMYGAGGRGAEVIYAVPNHRRTLHSKFKNGKGMHPFNTGAWRAPHASTNSFARESHIDLMASEARMDPLDFRLKNTKDAQFIRVMKAAADRFGWTPGKPPSGRGYGMAVGIDVGVPVVLMGEIAVDEPTGIVRVRRVVCAQDLGLVINPEGATLQAEGCITMGLGYALSEEVHFRGGQIFDQTFEKYQLPLFSWVPEIEVINLGGEGRPIRGGGEPAIIVVGAMIANGIYDAIGARVHTMPMTPDRVKAANS